MRVSHLAIDRFEAGDAETAIFSPRCAFGVAIRSPEHPALPAARPA
ncbi:MAG: hypothetical protein IT293_03610 [Deltaproteobacteria bacterium]|nr:hypothetical protein [Deltaproteobacteria bacterium]